MGELKKMKYTPVVTNHPQNLRTEQRNSCTDNISRQLVIICFAAIFGTSIPVGFNFSVSNALYEHIVSWSNATLINQYDIYLNRHMLELLWATIVTIVLIGGATSSLLGGWIANRFGRKYCFLASGFLYIFGAIFSFSCRTFNSVGMLLFGRLLLGLACGLSTSTAPMYLSEVAPLNLRGSVAVCYSLGIAAGLCLGTTSSMEELLGTSEHWHYSLAMFSLFVIISMLFFPWLPESPKYLYIIANNRDLAKEELKRIHGSKKDLIEEEMCLMENESKFRLEKRSIRSVLSDPTLRLPIVLVCCMLGGQQFSGITMVAYYSVPMFQRAGLNSNDAKWANLYATLLMLAVASFNPWIMAKCNRRPILLVSSLLCGISVLLLMFIIKFIDYAFWFPVASIVAVCMYSVCFEFGLGVVPDFIGSELFESTTRPSGMAIGSFTSWIFNISSALTFPLLQETWGAYVFLPNVIVCFALCNFLRIYLPETRNRNTTEIAQSLVNGFKKRPLLHFHNI